MHLPIVTSIYSDEICKNKMHNKMCRNFCLVVYWLCMVWNPNVLPPVDSI